MHIISYPGITWPFLVVVLTLSHALPTFLDLPPSFSPDLAPRTLDDREESGIIPTVFNVSRPSFQAAPNLAAPNPNDVTFEQILHSGVQFLTPHVQRLWIWRVITLPAMGKEGNNPADFTSVCLECKVQLPASGTNKFVSSTNVPSNPRQWQVPQVADDKTISTPFRPFDYAECGMALSSAFGLLQGSGLGQEVWAKIVQIAFFVDQVEPGTSTLYGTQVYYAFAKRVWSPLPPHQVLSWTLVGTFSGKIHRDVSFKPGEAPDTNFGMLPGSALNTTWMIA